MRNKNSTIIVQTCLFTFISLLPISPLLAAEPQSSPSSQPAATGPAVSIPAFPGAEGFGACSVGGRGGKVYVVTTLADYGPNDKPIPGSLRAAIDANEPRIIVFAVGGNITLKHALSINHPNVTIAGQTAPGDGICLKDFPLSVGNNMHDVIIRYIRIRIGDLTPGSPDSLGGRYSRNIIVDHCSASWSIDETVSFYRNENVTVQWCLISESLFRSHHFKGDHGYGGIWGGDKASFHHNLLAHHTSRNPRFNDGLIDYRNNVIYNWGFMSAYGGENGHVNIIANYYKAGPATRKSVRNLIVAPETTGYWYIADNCVEGFPDVTADNWKGVHWSGRTSPDGHDSYNPFPAAPVSTTPAQQAYEMVLADVGATVPKRDALDARVIEEVRTGTAHYGKTWGGGGKGIINSQEDVGGWPELKSGPAPLDSDADGMPDEWEKAHKLNPRDATDASKTAPSGYTWIEEYINSLVPAKAIK